MPVDGWRGVTQRGIAKLLGMSKVLPGRQLGESPGKGNVESGRLLCTRWALQLAWAFSDSKFLFFPVCLWGFLVWFGFCFFCLFFCFGLCFYFVLVLGFC